VTATVPPGAAAPAPAPARFDWTGHSSLIQPNQAAFWLFAALLVIGGSAFIDDQLFFADTSTTAWVVGLVLLGLFAVPVYLLVNALDLFEREPRSMLVGALLWGGVIATYLAANINGEWDSIIQKLLGAEFARDWGAAVVGPGVEELVKFLGIVVLYLIARDEFDDTLDGFVYGALIGLGFTLEEDMYYFFTHFVGQAGASDLGGLFEGFFVRVIVGGPYSHVLMTGLTGMGFAYFVTRPDVPRRRRLGVALLLYLAGVATHFVWNSPLLDDLLGVDPTPTTWLTWAAVKGLPFLALLVVLVRLAIRREQRSVRAALSDDVANGLISPEELDDLGDLRRRRDARRRAGARLGAAGGRLIARLQHAQIALAIAGSGRGVDRAQRMAVERARIAELRRELAVLAARAGASVAPADPAGTAARQGAPFRPDHVVPADGLPAWQLPDPAGPPVVLAPTLPLQVVQRLGDWAQVRASNDWIGWVDGRRLVPRPEPAANPPDPAR